MNKFVASFSKLLSEIAEQKVILTRSFASRF
jgi:hypothetical protein